MLGTPAMEYVLSGSADCASQEPAKIHTANAVVQKDSVTVLHLAHTFVARAYSNFLSYLNKLHSPSVFANVVGQGGLSFAAKDLGWE